MMLISNIAEIGIDALKAAACDMLLQHRVERKLKGKKITEVINRIQVLTTLSQQLLIILM